MLSGNWKKAPASNGSGGNNCVQVRCSTGTCVEVNLGSEVVQVRDSKLGDSSPVLSFTPAEWRAFLDGARAGEFDL